MSFFTKLFFGEPEQPASPILVRGRVSHFGMLWSEDPIVIWGFMLDGSPRVYALREEVGKSYSRRTAFTKIGDDVEILCKPMEENATEGAVVEFTNKTFQAHMQSFASQTS